MFIVLVLIIVAVAILGPNLWVRRVLMRYSKPEHRYEATGGQLARHLLDQLGLADVVVEATEIGDHYDPQSRAVRLTPDKLEGRSLTAITVAAHEVGHAMQHRDAYQPLMWRTRLAGLSARAEKLGSMILLALPVVVLITRVPAAGLLMFAGGMLSLGAGALVHLVTLPTEFDASFRRAMPMLEAGHLHEGDEPHARRLLKAAALTYVSGALMSLLSVARWLAILRR